MNGASGPVTAVFAGHQLRHIVGVGLEHDRTLKEHTAFRRGAPTPVLLIRR
jgi:hypothetical protein